MFKRCLGWINLTRLLQLSGIFALIACGLFVLQLRNTAREVQTTVIQINAKDGILARLNKSAFHIQAATEEIGRISIEGLKASKDQAESLKKENEQITGLISDIRTAVQERNQQMAVSISAITSDFGSITQDVGGTAKAATTALNAVPPVLDSAKNLLDKTAELIGDDDIKTSLLELSRSAKNIDDITLGIANMIKIVEGRVDALAHPSKKKKALTDALTILKLLYYISQVAK